MLLAFADAVGIAPARIVMVGDSTHDLHAGRAAGMQTVGVLTGLAGAETLAPLRRRGAARHRPSRGLAQPRLTNWTRAGRRALSRRPGTAFPLVKRLAPKVAVTGLRG